MKHSILLLFLLSFSAFSFGQSFADLIEKVDESVVQIHVVTQVNKGVGTPGTFTSAEGYGTGTLVGDEKKYILTAAHVVADASQIKVEFKDGTALDAYNRRVDRIADVAIIELERPVPDRPAAVIGNSDDVRIGDDIFIIGNPLGLAHSVSRGIVSSKHSENSKWNNKRLMEFFQTDAAINKGNSGGPMFNMKGELIGVVSSILSFSGGFEGLGFAATSNIAEEILMQRGRMWLGSESLLMSPELCQIFNVPQEGALMVQNVVQNSPAYFMGLKGGYLAMSVGDSEFLAGGDIILQFDDIVLNSSEQVEKLWEYLNSLPPKHEFTVKVYRRGEITSLRWRMLD